MIISGSQYIKNGKSHYERNKQVYIESTKQRKIRNKKFIWQYKSQHPCVDCGNSNPVVLDFDHLGGKEDSINHGANNGWSIKKLLEEISKCEVRCANCHRIITWKRNNKNAPVA